MIKDKTISKAVNRAMGIGTGLLSPSRDHRKVKRMLRCCLLRSHGDLGVGDLLAKTRRLRRHLTSNARQVIRKWSAANLV